MSYSSAERGNNIYQGSSISSSKGIFYHNLMLNNWNDGHLICDGHGGKDEETEGGLRAEEFEIRMDRSFSFA